MPGGCGSPTRCSPDSDGWVPGGGDSSGTGSNPISSCSASRWATASRSQRLVGREQVMAKFGRDMRYFNTFGGNPVSIAAATAVLDVIEEDRLIDNARDSGAYLIAGLRELAQRHHTSGDVRGTGLFVAVEIVGDGERKTPDAEAAAAIVNELRQRGVLISASGRGHNVLKISPPLPFTSAHADVLLAELDATLETPTQG